MELASSLFWHLWNRFKCRRGKTIVYCVIKTPTNSAEHTLLHTVQLYSNKIGAYLSHMLAPIYVTQLCCADHPDRWMRNIFNSPKLRIK